METDPLLAIARRLLRVRRGLEWAVLAGVGVFSVGAILRLLSVALPAPVWAAIPVGALIGGLFPREPERELLWAGRRLGVGGRLAALHLLLAREEGGLAGLVRRELEIAEPRWVAMFYDGGTALSAAALGLAVAAFLLMPSLPVRGPAPTPPLPEEAVSSGEAAPEREAQAEVPAQAAGPERVELPEDIAATLPFQDLLAEIYGLTPEEGPWATGSLGEGIQAQQGLLRKLSQEISRLASGGFSPQEQKALLPLIQQVARQDLREELLRLVQRGDEGAAEEAGQAVEAVRRAGEEAAQAAGTHTEAAQGPADTGSEGESPPAMAVANGGEAPGAGPDQALRGEQLAEEGDLAGLAPGDAETGGEEPPPQGAAARPTAPEVRPGEGPARGYLAAGVPVESGGEAPPTGGVYSPERAELVLTGRGVPLELRGVVRRYFELLAQGGSR